MIDLDRVLVTGGSGMVGSQVPFGIKPSHTELEITDVDSIARAFDTHKPSAVLHLAGVIDVKRAEENPAVAEQVNVGGSANLADAAAAAGIPIVYFSSCMVFDGEKASPYVESDTTNPLTVYGKTKLAGEQAVLERSSQALVVRTGWLFGGFEKDIKFIHRFYDALMAGKPLRATSDRYGSPTYVPDLIAETARLVQTGTTGVVHVVNADVASYYEVGVVLRALTGVSQDVQPVTQRELDPTSEPRGAMEALSSERGIELRSFKQALAEYVTLLGQRA